MSKQISNEFYDWVNSKACPINWTSLPPTHRQALIESWNLQQDKIDALTAQLAKNAAAPVAAIDKVLNEVMAEAVSNGANSVSMPDEYVEIAGWLCDVKPQAASDAKDAALWRALLGSARIRPLGSAGLARETEDPLYGHLGLELWTVFPRDHSRAMLGHLDAECTMGKQWLTQYAQKAILANAAALTK